MSIPMPEQAILNNNNLVKEYQDINIIQNERYNISPQIKFASQDKLNSYPTRNQEELSIKVTPQDTIQANPADLSGEIIDLISKLADILIRNKLYDSKSIDSIQKAIIKHPILQQVPKIEEFLNLPNQIANKIEQEINLTINVPKKKN